MSFFVWLISLSIIFSGFIRVVACIRISFLFKAELYSIECVNHILFIHSSVDGQLGCFHLLPISNNAAVNIGFHVLLIVNNASMNIGVCTWRRRYGRDPPPLLLTLTRAFSFLYPNGVQCCYIHWCTGEMGTS